MSITLVPLVALIALILPGLAIAQHRRPRFATDDRGEGVISAAIAVLIMAFIGALMWVGFRTIWQDAEANTKDCVNEIGSDASDGNCGGDVGAG